MRVLLANTKLQVQFNGIVTAPFESNIGSPQGDGLSPMLFALYLEAALRELEKRGIAPPKCDTDVKLPRKAIYADDTDFISLDKAFLEKILEMVGPVFSEFNLIVNVDKTEWTIIAHKDMLEFASSWEGTRKLGSLLGVEEDVSRRIQLATVSFQSLEVIWKHRSLVPTATRIRSYQALVESVLMYNCGTWGLTEAIADKLDRFQRKLLRRVMGISWSDRVTNEALHEESGITRASEQAIDARWRLFGHALRMHEDSPARQAMAYYFVNDQKGRQGNRTTIASALSDDYKAAFGKTIKTKEEYESMITLASNRNYWKEEIVAKVVSEYKKCKKDKYDRQKEKRKAKGKGKGGKK